MTSRAILLDCFRAALDAVDARRVVRDELTRRPLRGEWHVIAAGKAAAAMAQGATEALGTALTGGVIVVPPGHVPAGFNPNAHSMQVIYGSHPLPDEYSLAAGEAVAEYVCGLRSDAQLLCLVSGGASSLVERLTPGVALGELHLLNRWALQSGAPIEQINAARRVVSSLKGGGLARLAGSRRMRALMISDVPGDDPRVIGSGLLHAADHERSLVMDAMPSALQSLLRSVSARVASAATTPAVPVRIVASIGHACRAAAAVARRRGLPARVVRSRLAGDAAALGVAIAAGLSRQPAGILQVRGGESTVRLPAHPGRGGRNQHLALAAAIEFGRLQASGAMLLAAGTDGVDGASDDAGAIIDAGTCMRGRDAGMDPVQSLERADSGTFLEAAGDLLHTGPTLTNVGDLVLGLRS